MVRMLPLCDTKGQKQQKQRVVFDKTTKIYKMQRDKSPTFEQESFKLFIIIR